MPVFISRNKKEPFELVTSLLPIKSEVDIYQNVNISTEDVINCVYMIAENANYPLLRMRVEGEFGIGSSLWISKTNLDGDPIKWEKELIFKNINAADQLDMCIITMVKTKWSVVSNTKLLKSFNATAYINIYD